VVSVGVGVGVSVVSVGVGVGDVVVGVGHGFGLWPYVVLATDTVSAGVQDSDGVGVGVGVLQSSCLPLFWTESRWLSQDVDGDGCELPVAAAFDRPTAPTPSSATEETRSPAPIARREFFMLILPLVGLVLITMTGRPWGRALRACPG
jgi:hypothetical protein